MPGIVRKTDKCTGHGCFPPRRPSSWSPNVYVNGKQVVRQGDTLKKHCCPDHGCHGGKYLGSGKVMANGRAIQLKGDPIDCGSRCNNSSGTVSIG